MCTTPPRPSSAAPLLRGESSDPPRHSRAQPTRPRPAGALAISILSLALAACSSSPKPIPADGPVYPGDAADQTKVLNVQVLRSGPTITFTNTTAGPLGPCRMWLNQRFSRMIDRLDVGQSVSLDLYSFTDEFGDSFRGGGFFSMNRPDKLVLAQLESTDAEGKTTLLGLITIGGGEDD